MGTLADACSGDGEVSCLLFESDRRVKKATKVSLDAIAQE